MLQIERQFWNRGFDRVAGVDEAGRGPLAGPVVAAAALLSRDFVEREEHGVLKGMTDSKKLSESRREHFADLLLHSPDVCVGLGSAEPAEIDELNILRATCVAMARAVQSLSPLPDYALVDGLPVQGLPCPSTAIVKGDGRSLSIAAASIVAKVTRDARMRDLGRKYPEYGFDRHKGYGSQAHLLALFEYGPSPVHRRSFRPVREAADIRRRSGQLSFWEQRP